MTESEATITFYKLMYQHVFERFSKLKSANRKVAHYTSAENAINIISGKTIWLRNAALMNDFMEIRYGKISLINFLQQNIKETEYILNKCHNDLAEDIINDLHLVDFSVNSHTYITSFAEHPSDDELGKLSMWRAYGGPVAGVAIIFNLDVFEKEGLSEFHAPMFPVIYGPDEFEPVFKRLMADLQKHQGLIAQVPRDSVQSVLFHIFKDLILTTKHPGFREEEEWRIIHSPSLYSSAFVTDSVHTIRGIPQTIYKIELKNQPPLNAPELELDNLIHRIIIGPCQYPRQVADAIATALDRANVKEPYSRIAISDIPLRQQG